MKAMKASLEWPGRALSRFGSALALQCAQQGGLQMASKIQRAKEKLSGKVMVPALLWMGGVPLGLVVILWFFFFRGR
jgi:hypothetical protein